MQIILRETFENLGRTGDIVEVKDGYARNFLVPKGIAYPKNRFYSRLFEAERDELLRKDALAHTQAEETAGKAASIEISFTVKIGDRGKMFGAITNVDIAAQLAQKGIEIDRRKIDLPEPIKTTGEHLVPVKLHGEVGFTVKVDVIPEAPPEDELDDDEKAALEATQVAEAEADDGEAPAPSEVVELIEAVPLSEKNPEESQAEPEKPTE